MRHSDSAAKHHSSVAVATMDPLSVAWQVVPQQKSLLMWSLRALEEGVLVVSGFVCSFERVLLGGGRPC